MERKIDYTESENYLSLIPEIAQILNMSVSSVKSFPNDIQQALCSTYVNNYHSDPISIKQELGKIIHLNAETEREIDNLKRNDCTSGKKEISISSIFSREQISRNAKLIEEKYRQDKMISGEVREKVETGENS